MIKKYGFVFKDCGLSSKLYISLFGFLIVMVLESLIDPINASKSKLNLIALGFLYASVGLFVGLLAWPGQASLVLVFLTVMASMPFVYNLLKIEEEKDTKIKEEVILLKEHSKALGSLMLLFLGFTIGFAFWYSTLPSAVVQPSFSTQVNTIVNLNSNVVGYTSSGLNDFTRVLLNNVKVLMFCILFAFLYGVGAIFILVWNASVIGVAIGNFIRKEISLIASKLHLTVVSNYFRIVSVGFLQYILHAIPEILAYFTGGMAGAIISIAVINHEFGTEKFEKVLIDSIDLILIAIGLLIVAAFIEVYITPPFRYFILGL